MPNRAMWCSIAAVVTLLGCSRQETTACEPDVRYSTARSAPPVQIPDDLSPPNENDALRLPPDVGAIEQTAAGECLEAPPSFFGDSRPFRRSAESEEQPAPAEQNEPPPSDGDRVIDN
jgi:hypothetical protein